MVPDKLWLLWDSHQRFGCLALTGAGRERTHSDLPYHRAAKIYLRSGRLKVRVIPESCTDRYKDFLLTYVAN